MNIFDTHSHYADAAFDADRERVLSELPNKGVKLVMLAASGMDDSTANSQLSKQYDYVYSAVGIHPESVDETPAGYRDKLRRLISSNPKIKAVGEIGLDYHYENYDREKQIRFFREQLEFAAELDMPVIVHSRNATEDTVEILKEYRPRGVVHCFSGSAETAKEILKLGMYIGFTGVLTFNNAKKALKALAEVPMDRLLLETDCPYMAPVPFRGKRCDSSMIAYTAEKAAEIKGLPVQELIDMTCRNGMAMYGITE
ncbi:MAG: TatD family hydrolase [Ruminococcus sp.]|uniref:TatD family hydrolase n=1 Tax=Ruminococcus sp. TaxID=41978 RepID=UPI0025FAC059|nr:TatD family hydrolase [Ruminococcus sp.]MCR5599966.1 TatD family hydrolase [Ruminococcus sp.]